MTRTPIAVALILTLASPALAQTPPAAEPHQAPPAEAAKPPEPPKLFALYGALNLNLQFTQAMGATLPAADVKQRFAVSPDSTNLGIRGTYDLPATLYATYQCETSANLDGISASGICNRNSRLGLGSATYGTLFYGNWDTPYKAMAYGTKADDPFLNTDVYGFDGLMSSPGFNYRSSTWSTASSSAIGGFDVRAGNAVGYFSPSWYGVSFKLLWGANEFKNASGTQNPNLYSGVVNYDRGPISVSGAYERHEDGFALVFVNPATPAAAAFGATAPNTPGTALASIHSSDSAWRVAAGYQLDWGMGTTTPAAMVEQLMLEQNSAPTGAVRRFDRFAWQVSLKHRAGNHELRARYSMADRGSCKLGGGAPCSTSGYGASNLALGYAYFLAKTTQVYLHYAMIWNDRRAQYTFTIGGSPAVAGNTPAGADPLAVGMGIRYAF